MGSGLALFVFTADLDLSCTIKARGECQERNPLTTSNRTMVLEYALFYE